jgi:hypothetical protein
MRFQAVANSFMFFCSISEPNTALKIKSTLRAYVRFSPIERNILMIMTIANITQDYT